MRIIRTDHSHDYYDGLSNNSDSIKYIRHAKIQEIDRKTELEINAFTKSISFPLCFSRQRVFSKYDLCYGIPAPASQYGLRFTSNVRQTYVFAICFCGNVFPGIIVDSVRGYNGNIKEEQEIYYNFNDFLSKYNTQKSAWELSYDFDHTNLGVLQALFDGKLTSLGRLNIEMKSPIILIGNVDSAQDFFAINKPFALSIVMDANLKKLEFGKVMDANQCIQNVETFVSNQLVSDQMPMNPISDKLKAETHGFNKYSFRKDPTRKSRNV